MSAATSERVRAGRIKGAAFGELLRWFFEHHPGRVAAAVERVAPGDLRPDPRKPGMGILAGSWYPAPEVHALLDALVAGLPRAERTAIARAAARATMDRTLRGLYKLLFDALATPERYARHAQRLWNSYYDGGTLTVTPRGDGADSVVSDWAAHHPLICEMHVHAAAFIYEAMGKKDVSATRLECVATGASACRFSVSWRD
jgi:hypothetical protein